MNVVFISYWSCPLTRLGVLTAGGMNVYVLNLANNLGMLGHKVDIYTKVHRENDEKVLKTHKNVRIIHLSYKKDNYYQATESFAKRVLWFINKNSFKCDIIHAHYYYSALIGLKLKTRLSLPLVTTFHTLGAMKELYGGIRDEKRIRAEKEITEKDDGIIASTEFEARDLSDVYHTDKKKLFVVPPGVNHHLFKPLSKKSSRLKVGIPLDKKVVLFVGRIDPIKGISLLIESVSKLKNKYPTFEDNFRVILIGGDIESRSFWNHPEVKKIKNLINKLDLSCCVKFIGSKSHHELPYYYSSSDVVVMPSKYESFGFVILEALSCGSCVLAAKVGGLSYLIKDKLNGRLFKSGNRDELTKVLWELLKDDRQRKRLGEQAIVSSQKFCWDIQAKKIVSLYKKLI